MGFFLLNFNGGPCIELIDDKHIKIEDAVVKISGSFYTSYTQIKEEFIDEDEKDDNLENEYENDDNKYLKKNSNHNKNSNKNSNNKSNYDPDDTIENDNDIYDESDLPSKLINKYGK